MRIESTGKIINEVIQKKPISEIEYDDVANFLKEFESLQSFSDFIIVKVNDESIFTAKNNYEGGRCSCCGDFTNYYIQEAEGFKIIYE